jgi:hypothetical protein
MSESARSDWKTAIRLHNRYKNDGGEGVGPEEAHYVERVIAAMRPEVFKVVFPDGVNPQAVAAFLEPK